MKNFIKYNLILLLITVFFLGAGQSYAAVFPGALNSFSTGDVIEAFDWNALEATIGITNSASSTSHDYLIRQASSSLYK